MKNVKNALRVSVLLILISFVVSCSSKSGGAGGGGIPDPNPTPGNSAKINTFDVSPASVIYNGQPTSGTAILNWTSTNAISAKLNSADVPTSGTYTTATLFETGDYTLVVTDSKGNMSTPQTRRVIVSIDPLFAKMCGSSGQSWKTTSNTALNPDGSLQELLQPSELDDVFTFYPTARWTVEYGTLNPAPPNDEEFKFNSLNSVTGEIAIQNYAVQPVRKVEFPSSTTMTWTYTKNGVVYTRYFEKKN